jgi:hypothetical protein
VEKTGDFEIANDIGQIFQKHNIMEYKSENDTLNEDTYFKVMAYAYLYKSSEKYVGDIDINSITITLVRERKPEKLLRWFKENSYKVYEKTSGIYYIEKDGFRKRRIYKNTGSSHGRSRRKRTYIPKDTETRTEEKYCR